MFSSILSPQIFYAENSGIGNGFGRAFGKQLGDYFKNDFGKQLTGDQTKNAIDKTFKIDPAKKAFENSALDNAVDDFTGTAIVDDDAKFKVPERVPEYLRDLDIGVFIHNFVKDMHKVGIDHPDKMIGPAKVVWDKIVDFRHDPNDPNYRPHLRDDQLPGFKTLVKELINSTGKNPKQPDPFNSPNPADHPPNGADGNPYPHPSTNPYGPHSSNTTPPAPNSNAGNGGARDGGRPASGDNSHPNVQTHTHNTGPQGGPGQPGNGGVGSSPNPADRPSRPTPNTVGTNGSQGSHGNPGSGNHSGGNWTASQVDSRTNNRVNDGFGGAKPIILDLDGSGIKVTELSQSTRFVDATGDGLQHRMAWAGAGCGVLFFDANGDGLISSKREFVFTQWDPTARGDLEAIRSVFDTDHNGWLDAGDTAKRAANDNGGLDMTAAALHVFGLRAVFATGRKTRQRVERRGGIRKLCGLNVRAGGTVPKMRIYSFMQRHRNPVEL